MANSIAANERPDGPARPAGRGDRQGEEREGQNTKPTAAKSQAAFEATLNRMDPRVRALIDPEAPGGHYDVITWYLREQPEKLLETVLKAFQDDVVRVLEVQTIEIQWETNARQGAKARTQFLLQELQNDSHAGTDRLPKANSQTGSMPPAGAGGLQLAMDQYFGQPDTKSGFEALRAELVAAALRGEKLSEETPKLIELLEVKPDAAIKLETNWKLQCGPAQYVAIERYLRLHPAELQKRVANAYEDGKVTLFEYDLIQAVHDQIEKKDAKARLNAAIKELLAARKGK